MIDTTKTTDPPKRKVRKPKPEKPKPKSLKPEKPTPEARPTLTVVERRLTDSSARIGAVLLDEIQFQHTVFCQTVLPYRDPGPEIRKWEQDQGQVSLMLEAGYVKDPRGRYVPVGLPYGPAARLLLCHLNTEALQTACPVINTGDSLTRFVRRVQGFNPNGREIRKIREQLIRLTGCTIRLAISRDRRTVQMNSQIITVFEVWEETSEGDRFLFPQKLRLSADYFESLHKHAVPLDERAIAALAHSAMALDVYAWLAQRLHRVDPQRGQFIPWKAFHAQFGQGWREIRLFRRVFKIALSQALAVYPTARVKVDKGGMLLGHSPPPVGKRVFVLPKPKPER